MDAVGLALVLLLALASVASLRLLAADRPSLGDIVRYRRPTWPRGVQEDDDARWGWRPAPDPAAPAVESVRGRVRAAHRD